MTDNTPMDVNQMDFETAFQALQENVGLLENEELPLEKALELFERGQLLAKRCSTLLEQAELRVCQLTSEGEQTPEGEE